MVLVGDPGGLDGAIALRLRPFSERAVATVLHLELGHAVDPTRAGACSPPHSCTRGVSRPT
jgi:hypothetical protein